MGIILSFKFGVCQGVCHLFLEPDAFSFLNEVYKLNLFLLIHNDNESVRQEYAGRFRRTLSP